MLIYTAEFFLPKNQIPNLKFPSSFYSAVIYTILMMDNNYEIVKESIISLELIAQHVCVALYKFNNYSPLKNNCCLLFMFLILRNINVFSLVLYLSMTKSKIK